MATKANLLIDQGTTFSTTIIVSDDEGNSLNLEGYTGAAQLRKHYTSSNSVSFNVSISGTTGEVTLALTANATTLITPGRYVYDCEIRSGSGVVSRILEGIITVTPEVTR